MTSVIEMRTVASLKPHPRNSEIYGDDLDAAFIESINVSGVLQPVLITNDGLVIDGNRRMAAARAAGITEAPVIVADITDELDILERILDCNRQRVKTNEQHGREARCWLKIEREKAKRRQATAQVGNRGGKSLPAKSPEATGDARDAAAERTGLKAKRLEEMVAVVEAIDALKKSGKTKKAEELRDVLNKKTVHTAHQKAKRAGYFEAAGLKKASKAAKNASKTKRSRENPDDPHDTIADLTARVQGFSNYLDALTGHITIDAPETAEVEKLAAEISHLGEKLAIMLNDLNGIKNHEAQTATAAPGQQRADTMLIKPKQ